MLCDGDASAMVILRSTTFYLITCSAHNLHVFLQRDVDLSSKSLCVATMWLCFEPTSDKGSCYSLGGEHSLLSLKAINLLVWKALQHFAGPSVPYWPQEEEAFYILFWWT